MVLNDGKIVVLLENDHQQDAAEEKGNKVQGLSKKCPVLETMIKSEDRN
jgi:hypothetical protein